MHAIMSNFVKIGQTFGEISQFYGFYRATACNATHGIAVAILSVCPFVCLSVRRMRVL